MQVKTALTLIWIGMDVPLTVAAPALRQWLGKQFRATSL